MLIDSDVIGMGAADSRSTLQGEGARWLVDAPSESQLKIAIGRLSGPRKNWKSS
jgi:hypothetical protein